MIGNAKLRLGNLAAEDFPAIGPFQNVYKSEGKLSSGAEAQKIGYL